jgi:hypothetical protein
LPAAWVASAFEGTCFDLLLGFGTKLVSLIVLADECDFDEEDAFDPRAWLTDGPASSGQEPGIVIFSSGTCVSSLDEIGWSFRDFERSLGSAVSVEDTALVDVSLTFRVLFFELDSVAAPSASLVLRIFSFGLDKIVLSSTSSALRVLSLELDSVVASSTSFCLRILSLGLDEIVLSPTFLAFWVLSFELDCVITSSTSLYLRVLSFEVDKFELSSAFLAFWVLSFELDRVVSSPTPLALRVLAFGLEGVALSSASRSLLRKEASSDLVLLALGGAAILVFTLDLGGDDEAKEDCADLGRTVEATGLSTLLGWPKDWSDFDLLALGCVSGTAKFGALLEDFLGVEPAFGGGSSSRLASARLSLLRDLLVEVLVEVLVLFRGATSLAVLSLSGFRCSVFSLAVVDFATVCAGWERLGVPIDPVRSAGTDGETPRLLVAATVPISRSMVASMQAARYLPALCDNSASSCLGTSGIDEMASSICENSFFDLSYCFKWYKALA